MEPEAEPVESLSPFWGVLEIAGILALVVPFIVTTSSVSMETRNGQVTHFLYRDWAAVVCGVLAVLCGLGAAARWKSTQASKRGLRLAVVVALVGLGGFQIARGYGLFASPPADDHWHPPDIAHEPAIDRPAPPTIAPPAPAPDKPSVDLDTPTTQALALWEAGKAAALREMGSPRLKNVVTADDVATLIARVAAAVGACGPLTSPIAHTFADGAWKTKATLKCGAHELVWTVKFAKDSALIDLVNVDTAAPAKIESADADALATTTVAELLAARTSKFREIFDAAVLAKLGELPTTGKQIAKVLADAGKRGAPKVVESKNTGDTVREYIYDVPGATHHLTISLTASFFLARWFITDFNIGPAAKK